jgi:hypothetical protein
MSEGGKKTKFKKTRWKEGDPATGPRPKAKNMMGESGSCGKLEIRHEETIGILNWMENNRKIKKREGGSWEKGKSCECATKIEPNDLQFKHNTEDIQRKLHAGSGKQRGAGLTIELREFFELIDFPKTLEFSVLCFHCKSFGSILAPHSVPPQHHFVYALCFLFKKTMDSFVDLSAFSSPLLFPFFVSHVRFQNKECPASCCSQEWYDYSFLVLFFSSSLLLELCRDCQRSLQATSQN